MKKSALLIAAVFLFLSAPLYAEEIKGKVTNLSDKLITITEPSGKVSTWPIKAGSHVHHMCAVNDMVVLNVSEGTAVGVREDKATTESDMGEDDVEQEEEKD